MKTRIFITTAGLLLALTALAKLVSAYQAVGYLNLRDPLFEFLTNRQLLSGAATLELVIVLLLLWIKSQQKRLALIAWISSMFLLYRLSVSVMRSDGFIIPPCPCMGNAAAWLHIDPTHLDWGIKLLLAYLLSGSYGLLIGLRLRRPKVSNEDAMRPIS